MKFLTTISPDVDSLLQPNARELEVKCLYPPVVECPICHKGLYQSELSSFFIEKGDGYPHRLFVLFFCPLCRSMFTHEFVGNVTVESGEKLFSPSALRAVTPMKPEQGKFSDAIMSLSPNFVNIYSQSQIAEADGLSEICGMGYRKAIEFLVKDYLIHKSPNEEPAICSKSLGECIKQIDDYRIQTLVSRAVWIGNDEAHYTRKHEDLDISSLKKFVNAVLAYIDSELAFEDADSISRK